MRATQRPTGATGDPPDMDRPPSLLGITIRRSTVLGRFFLFYGIGISVVLGAVFAITPGGTFSALPYIVPIFGAVGSMGSLQVFSSDRIKGTLEYFLAYGVSSRRLFANFLVAAIVLMSLVVGIGESVAIGVYLARGRAFSDIVALAFGLYAVPMSFATAAFATIVGMYWSALSSPRAGMNSPIGLAPFIGILPPVAVLVSITALAASGIVGSPGEYLAVAVTGAVIVAAAALTLLALVGRLLRNERFLSPA